MNRLESELFDLEELLMRNDDMADDGTYSTIVGIANDVSELEAENVKLRELVRDMRTCRDHECGSCQHGDVMDCRTLLDARLRKLGIEVDA